MSQQDYATLAFAPLQAGTSYYLVEPGERLIREDSPALKVMTDFHHIPPITIDEDINIEFALKKMKLAGVRLLLVTGIDEGITGIISSCDILGEKPIKLAQENKVSHAQILVKMVMIPYSEVRAVHMMSVQDAEVGHIIQTLKAIERQHLLVVDEDERGRLVICGLFSSSQISRQLGRGEEPLMTIPHSLAEMQMQLGG